MWDVTADMHLNGVMLPYNVYFFEPSKKKTVICDKVYVAVHFVAPSRSVQFRGVACLEFNVRNCRDLVNAFMQKFKQ